MRYACMLRGVNVSGQRKLTMKELVAFCTQIGFPNAESYLQSGNIILDSDMSAHEVESRLEQGICSQFGYDDVDVLAWNAQELGAAIASLPAAWQDYDPSKLHFTFVKRAASARSKPAGKDNDFAPDEYILGRDVAYVHCPNGYGRTKLNNSFFERLLNARATTRNWNTTQKLYELASG